MSRRRLSKRLSREKESVVIVSGLPRAGTSMMMRMLGAGGMELLTDNLRKPDIDNPRGYFEYEPVKETEHNKDWLEKAAGKAVKMVYALLRYLPKDYEYKIIFMERDMKETLASQRQMLLRRDKPAAGVPDSQMTGLYSKAISKVKAWLKLQPNMEVFYADYNAILRDSAGFARKINIFLGSKLDTASMAGAVEKSLYRQRL
jgi:hypothetical protein